MGILENIIIVVILIAIILYVFKVNYSKDNNLTTVSLVLILLSVLILVFTIWNGISIQEKGKLRYSSSQIRNITMIFTAILALGSLIVTIYLTNRNSKFNLITQQTNLLMTLIKNNYSLVEKIEKKNEKSSEIDFFLRRLENKLSYPNLCFENFSEKFSEELKNINFENLIEQAVGLDLDDKVVQFIKDIDFKKRNINFEILLLNICKNRNLEFYETLPTNLKNKVNQNKIFTQEICETLMSNSFFFINDITPIINKLNFDEKLSYDYVSNKVNTIYGDYYHQFGHFFRNVHRIVKLINEYHQNDPINKKNMLGILRSQFSEDILLILYYNCTYTQKGLGLARQLIDSDFFGDAFDIEEKNTHFREDRLLYKSKDISIISEFFIKNSSKDTIIYKTDKELKLEINKVFEKHSL